jgi:hypothetical protein
MKRNCSNCGTQIKLNLAAEAAEYTTAAYGKASKRVQAQLISNPLWVDYNGLVCWDAPCCKVDGESYGDSLEPWEYPAIEQLLEKWG